MAGKAPRHVAEVGRERGRGSVVADEDEAGPGLETQGCEAPVGGVEAGRLVHARGAPQAAVQPVAPGVVGAGQAQAGAGAFGQAGAAVAAAVGEGAKRAVLLPQQQHRPAHRLDGEPAAPGHLVDAADELPGAGKDPLRRPDLRGPDPRPAVEDRDL